MNQQHWVKHTLLLIILIGLYLVSNISVVSAASLEINGGSQTLYGNLSYDYVNITNGGILYVTAYNGTSGTGTLNLTILYDVTVDATSSINGSKRGYRGGTGTTGSGPGGEVAGNGGGINGWARCSPYDGSNNAGGGGSGGYGTVGSDGSDAYCYQAGIWYWGGHGDAGSTKGTTSGWDIDMGSGAGAGGSGHTTAGGNGEAGGGMLKISARNINISGSLTFIGGNGGIGADEATYDGGNGAGASGGGILLNGTYVNISNSNINLSGGVGGGKGRFKVFYKGTITNVSTTLNTGTASYLINDNYPTVPTITNPTNNSVGYEVTSVNMTWLASTDADGDTITYNYKIANDSAFTDLLFDTVTSNTYSGSKTIPANTQIFFKVGAYDGYQYTWSPVVSIRDLSLSTPANNSISYFNYPPMITAFSFVWSATASSVVNYNLLIARDINFNVIASDTTFSGTSKSISLSEDVYWYKIRAYYTATGTYGAYTPAWSFTLIGNVTTPSGNGLHGIVYETISGSVTPINSAKVFIYNSTWSDFQITGSNGYYIFPLANGSYDVKATKTGYDDGDLFTVNVTGGYLSRDLFLQKCTAGDLCYYGQIEQQIYFLYNNGTSLKGNTVNLFEGDDVLPVYTLQTDGSGMISARLVEGTRYRIEIYNIGGTTNLITTSTDRYFYPINVAITRYITSAAGTPHTGTTNTSSTNYTHYGDGSGIAGMNKSVLESKIGLGALGQGCLVGFIALIIGGAGGAITLLFSIAILAVLGFVSWNMMFYFVMTAASIYILKEM